MAQLPGAITSAEAEKHIGREATVCGPVVSTRYLDTSANRATFLNFDRPNPNQTFTVVIFGDHRDKFDQPEVRLKGKFVCVTGRISGYRGVPQIVATDADQIREAKPAPPRIHSTEAADHIGGEVSVCGYVAAARHDTTAEGSPTYLFFERPFPEQTFTAVIFEDVRKKFGAPALKYLHRNVCVTGKPERLETLVRIVLTDPKQIAVQ